MRSFDPICYHGLLLILYQIQALESEVSNHTSVEPNGTEIKPKSLKACVHEGILQMKPLFMGSYFARLLLAVTIQFCGMLRLDVYIFNMLYI